ncbi:gas vesicle protein [Actinomycetota bacterium Odt1-20B]
MTVTEPVTDPVVDPVFERREVALVDLLDRLLAGGVVITGDLTLRIADVDLVRIDLKALISSVSERVPSPWGSTETWED